MEFTAPLSTIMTKKLITVTPGDKLSYVKDIFDTSRIHHIPVVINKTLVGLITRSGLVQFVRGAQRNLDGNPSGHHPFEHLTAEDVMTTGLATLQSTDRINVAIEVLAENLFHAIPIVDDGELVGIVTTLDLIKSLQAEDTNRIKSNPVAN